MIKDLRKVVNQLIDISRQSLLVTFRYFDTAIGLLNFQETENIGCLCTDSEKIYYDINHIVKLIKSEESIDNIILHITLHLILGHIYNAKDKDKKLWDLACDLEVESIIYESNLEIKSNKDNLRIYEIEEFKQKNVELYASSIYKYLLRNTISDDELSRLSKLFKRDDHYLWYDRYDFENEEDKRDNSTNKTFLHSRKDLMKYRENGINRENEQRWKQCLNTIKNRINTSSKEYSTIEGNIYQKIKEVKKDELDYFDFLKKFATDYECMNINEDEFDYIYYTYGLFMYSNIPLIEPLEYKDDNKIREFVIVIDTSGSCSGEVVQKFLEKTYSILSNKDYFSNEIKVHIIQADVKIQADYIINSLDDFEDFISTQKFLGFGGTDFRPAFEYIDNLVELKELTNLKGVLYFTDGYGTFPDKSFDYKVAFVFLDNGMKTPQVPEWAMKIVVGDERFYEED